MKASKEDSIDFIDEQLQASVAEFDAILEWATSRDGDRILQQLLRSEGITPQVNTIEIIKRQLSRHLKNANMLKPSFDDHINYYVNDVELIKTQL